MQALIDPNYKVENGVRVCEVTAQSFEVAAPLFWVECPEDCQADLWFYNTETEAFEPKPVEEIEVVTEGGA